MGKTVQSSVHVGLVFDVSCKSPWQPLLAASMTPNTHKGLFETGPTLPFPRADCSRFVVGKVTSGRELFLSSQPTSSPSPLSRDRGWAVSCLCPVQVSMLLPCITAK